MLARTFAVASLLLVASCKQTVEGESQAFTGSLERVQKLSVLYPGFAGALGQERKRAEEVMAAAKSIGDKEAAARKMGEANTILSSPFINTLALLDGKQKALREKVVAMHSAADADQAGARAAAEDAERVLRQCDQQLQAGAADATAAATIVQKLDGDLRAATSNVARVIDAAQKRKQEAAKNAAAAPGSAAGAGAVAATWKCKFCNHVNDASAKKCPNCGAPQPASPSKPSKH